MSIGTRLDDRESFEWLDMILAVFPGNFTVRSILGQEVQTRTPVARFIMVLFAGYQAIRCCVMKV